MPTIHFLNVNDGDCSLIQHVSNKVTVIDVCNAKPLDELARKVEKLNQIRAGFEKGVNGNFNQKKYPVNPISYMQDQGIRSVFRFILTHPDMDHMDGIEAFFAEFSPANLWDTDNTEEKPFGNGINQGYSEEDWKFYKRLRDGKPEKDPKRLTLYSGSSGQFYNQGESSQAGGDGLHILAPTLKLLSAGNECEDFNDCSYVILYKTSEHRIVFAGDSHDDTWGHILAKHKKDVEDVDLLVAPHHGRHSDRDWEFLDVLNPALTLFANAGSEHLAYSAWSNRGLPIITNNQAGSVIINAGVDPMDVYVTCEAYAKASNPRGAGYSSTFGGYYWGEIKRAEVAVA
jgi:beta-lactamase superfamily II metal-dependent hydrolase